MGFFRKKKSLPPIENKAVMPEGEAQAFESENDSGLAEVVQTPSIPSKQDKKTQPPAIEDCGLEQVFGSRNWHIEQSSRLFKLCLILSLALVLSIGGIIFLILSRPKPVYFAATPDLRVMELPPLSAPVVSDQAIVNWAAEVVTNALSLDFLQYRQKLMVVRNDFDPEAFTSFVNSLSTTGNLKKILDERLNLSCVVREAPVVTNSGVVGGKMTWKVEMPILLSYQSSKGIVASQNLVAKVLIQRTSTLNNPKGVVIKQIVLMKG